MEKGISWIMSVGSNNVGSLASLARKFEKLTPPIIMLTTKYNRMVFVSNWIFLNFLKTDTKFPHMNKVN